jgi:hypothetical protein
MMATNAAGDSLLDALHAVLGSTLSSTIDTQGVQRSTNHVVSNTRKVANPTTTNQNNRVFLEVVAFATDVSGDFLAIGQANTCHLPKRGVRLLGGDGSYL